MAADNIASIAAAITAVITLATVVVSLVVSLRSKKRIETVKQTTDEIHVLANDRMTTVIERVDQLTRALREAGVAVPPRQRKRKERKGNARPFL